MGKYLQIGNTELSKRNAGDIGTFLLISISILLWASVFVGIRAAIKAYNPFELAVFRFFISSIVLLSFAFTGKIRVPDKRDFILFLSIGFVMFLNAVLLNYGARVLTAGETNLIISTSQLFQVLLACLFLKEKVSLRFITGLILSFFGVALITIRNSGFISLNRGAFYVLIAAIVNAIFFILQKPLLKRYRPIEVISYAIWIATILMLPFGKSILEKFHLAGLNYTVIVFYIGLSAIIANLCWSTVLSKVDASRAAVFLYTIPVVTIIIGFLWLHELPSVMSCIGGVIIIAGVVVSNLKNHRKETSINI